MCKGCLSTLHKGHPRIGIDGMCSLCRRIIMGINFSLYHFAMTLHHIKCVFIKIEQHCFVRFVHMSFGSYPLIPSPLNSTVDNLAAVHI